MYVIVEPGKSLLTWVTTFEDVFEGIGRKLPTPYHEAFLEESGAPVGDDAVALHLPEAQPAVARPTLQGVVTAPKERQRNQALRPAKV